MEKDLNYYSELINERLLSENEILDFISNADEFSISKLLSSQPLSENCLDKLLHGKWISNRLIVYQIIINQILSYDQIKLILKSEKSNIQYLIIYQDLTGPMKNCPNLIVDSILSCTYSVDINLEYLMGFQNVPSFLLSSLKVKCKKERINSPNKYALFTDLKKSSNGSIVMYIELGNNERRVDRLDNLSGYFLKERVGFKGSYIALELPYVKERYYRLRPVDKFSKIFYIKDGKRNKLL